MTTAKPPARYGAIWGARPDGFALPSYTITGDTTFNSPYPSAPFSTLYLFGRGQDIGFQKAIDNSPRKRHHIRFWALSQKRARATWGTADFWLNTERPPDNESVLWIGAGTRDTGLSLTRLSFQITHATDSDTNTERDYIVGELRKNRSIEAVKVYKAGENLLAERVNHYITDGEITLVILAENAIEAVAVAPGGRHVP